MHFLSALPRRSLCRLVARPVAQVLGSFHQRAFQDRRHSRSPFTRTLASALPAMESSAAAPAATVPPKAREEPPDMQQEAALLEAFAQIPGISKGWCFPAGDGVRVTLQMSQRNLAANSMRKYLTHFSLNEAVLEHGEVETSMPLELKDVAMVSPSPSGNRTVIVRGGSNDTSAVVEVWGRGCLLKEIHVPKALHGSIYNDGWFGSGMAWSPDESKLAYVAEAPVAAKTPEWGARMGPDSKKAEGAAPKAWRGVGEWAEDWGELNTGKRAPTLFVLDCASWEVAAVKGLPEETSCGQPVWAPEGDVLLFVAWEHHSSNFPQFSQRLGIVFCFNRPCALYALPWPQQAAGDSSAGTAGEAAAAVATNGASQAGSATAVPAATCVTPSLSSAFSPRFGLPAAQRAQQQLVFLSQAAAVTSGVHSATSALHSMSWKAARRALESGAPPPTPRTLVDPVWNAPWDEFPGLYCNALPDQPFLAGGSSASGGEGAEGAVVVATTQWRSLTAVVAMDLGSGRVERVSPDNGACWSVVASGNGWVVAQESSPSTPGQLYAAHVTPSGAAGGSWCWSRLPLPGSDEEGYAPEVREHLQCVAVDVLRLSPSVGSRDVQYEAVVVYRKDLPGPRPTIITPHGGPHSAYTAQFFMPLSFMTALGYNVVLLNYRGSVGFGEASIQSLPGNIGTNDVADCWDSLQAAVEKGYADPNHVAVIGGSHGGFLTGHLVGQHAGAFRCGVLRNPVCDISLMVYVSDIPDWCYVEAFGTQEAKHRAAAKPSPEDLKHLRSISPAAHVDKVSCPLFFMLGAKDRRVPLEDAKQYMHALRARPGAPPSRVIVFPEDTHALDKPQTEFEQWLNAAWWLKAHMGVPEGEQ